MKFNLETSELEIIQLALVKYIIDNKNKREIKDYVERAKCLLDNIDFYKRQTR